MTRIPPASLAASAAPSPSPSSSPTRAARLASRSTTFLLLLFLGHILAASASQAPALPLPTFHHDVVAVAPGAAAADVPEHHNHHHHNLNSNEHLDQQQQLLHRHDSRQGGAYTPLVTPAPSNGDKPDAQALQDQGFRQETYYTCVTPAGGQEHCGWHVPVLKAKHGSAAAVPGRATDTGIVVAVVAGLAGVFAVGMM